jgi:hypothetical protein
MRMKIRNVAAVIATLALVVGTVPKARAQLQTKPLGGAGQPVDEQDAHEMQQAEEVSKRHTAELLKIHHVRKVVAERNAQKEIAILVQVDDPKYLEEVTNKLPSQIEGFPVDVDAAFTATAGAASLDADDDVDLGEGFSVDTGFAKKPPANPASTNGAKSDESSD